MAWLACGTQRLTACFDESHYNDSAPVASWFQFTPIFSVVFGYRQPRGLQSRPHDYLFVSLRIDNAMQRGDFLRGCPGIRRWQTIAPGQATSKTLFIENGAFAVSLGIDAQNSFSTFQQTCRGVTKMLTRITMLSIQTRLGRLN